MNTTTAQWIVALCVLIMAVGQIMFKQVAVNYNKLGAFLDVRVAGLLCVAGLLYVLSTALWVWALRTVEISKAYPLFALGFVLVPLIGAWLFGEQLSIKFAAGVALIIAGVLLIGRS